MQTLIEWNYKDEEENGTYEKKINNIVVRYNSFIDKINEYEKIESEVNQKGIDIVIKEKIPFVVYTKNDLGKIQTKITKNDFYKDYFSTYAGLTKHMKEENKISVYQTVCGEADKEVYLGDILLSDAIVEGADLYKLKVDEKRNIEAVFGMISPDENDDTIFDKWKSQLVIDIE